MKFRISKSIEVQIYLTRYLGFEFFNLRKMNSTICKIYDWVLHFGIFAVRKLTPETISILENKE